MQPGRAAAAQGQELLLSEWAEVGGRSRLAHSAAGCPQSTCWRRTPQLRRKNPRAPRRARKGGSDGDEWPAASEHARHAARVPPESCSGINSSPSASSHFSRPLPFFRVVFKLVGTAPIGIHTPAVCPTPASLQARYWARPQLALMPSARAPWCSFPPRAPSACPCCAEPSQSALL